MQEFVYYASLGVAGAGAFELLKAYELRGKLHQKKYQKLIRDPWFWLVTAGMLVASGFFAWAYYAESDPAPKPIQPVVAGIACRTLIRALVEALVANSKTKLGDDDNPTLADAFR